MPLIAVGSGAFLIPDKLPGVSRVIQVEHGDCRRRTALEIIESEDMPLACVPGNSVRVRVVGDVAGS